MLNGQLATWIGLGALGLILDGLAVYLFLLSRKRARLEAGGAGGFTLAQAPAAYQAAPAQQWGGAPLEGYGQPNPVTPYGPAQGVPQYGSTPQWGTDNNG